MDRGLEARVIWRRRSRRLGTAGAFAALVVVVLLLLPGWLRPSIARASIQTAKVDRGPVEAVISADGTVLPAFEVVLSSPLEARVTKILRRPGTAVRPGDEIVRLDTASFELERGRLGDQMAQKVNQQEQLRLALEKSLIELRGQIETKRLDAEVLEARADDNRRLRKDGLVSDETLRVAEAEAKKAAIEVRQLEASAGATGRSTQAQLASLDLDLRILRKDRDEAERQIALATVRADCGGVLTWVVAEEGATAHKGDVLARVADLDSFRVAATVSDVHSARLSRGQPVRVRLDGRELAGRLASINPAIEDGAVRFSVELAEPRDPRLRSNLRVDVLVVTGFRGSALRLRKGPFADEGGAESVFVVRGGEALRRPVRLGLAGFDQFEVLDGLEPGDEVIISDMKDFRHLTRLKLD